MTKLSLNYKHHNFLKSEFLGMHIVVSFSVGRTLGYCSYTCTHGCILAHCPLLADVNMELFWYTPLLSTFVYEEQKYWQKKGTVIF